jgi:hypothetical protein
MGFVDKVKNLEGKVNVSSVIHYRNGDVQRPLKRIEKGQSVTKLISDSNGLGEAYINIDDKEYECTLNKVIVKTNLNEYNLSPDNFDEQINDLDLGRIKEVEYYFSKVYN